MCWTWVELPPCYQGCGVSWIAMWPWTPKGSAPYSGVFGSSPFLCSAFLSIFLSQSSLAFSASRTIQHYNGLNKIHQQNCMWSLHLVLNVSVATASMWALRSRDRFPACVSILGQINPILPSVMSRGPLPRRAASPSPPHGRWAWGAVRSCVCDCACSGTGPRASSFPPHCCRGPPSRGWGGESVDMDTLVTCDWWQRAAAHKHPVGLFLNAETFTYHLYWWKVPWGAICSGTVRERCVVRSAFLIYTVTLHAPKQLATRKSRLILHHMLLSYCGPIQKAWASNLIMSLHKRH